MKASELRIGNWVVSDNQDPTQQPYQVEASHFSTNVLGDKLYADPIPLTEEWLVKFGFAREAWPRKFMGGVATWTHPQAESAFEITEYESPNDFCVEVFDRNICIETVHELQNWWYLVEGCELEIVEPKSK